MFIPDPDLEFLPIPDPGVKKAPNPGSGSATLVTDNQSITVPNTWYSKRPAKMINYSLVQITPNYPILQGSGQNDYSLVQIHALL
jgi:hypothetical protein